MRDGKVCQNHAVEKLENTQVDTDAKSQCEQGGRCECRSPTKLAKRVAKIGEHRLEQVADARLAHAVLHLLQAFSSRISIETLAPAYRTAISGGRVISTIEFSQLVEARPPIFKKLDRRTALVSQCA